MTSQPAPAIFGNHYANQPDAQGRFGDYGGRFVAETLMPLVLELEKAYQAACCDPSFTARLDEMLRDYVGRPSPLYFAERLSDHFGGVEIYFKRDELNHTGSHKINNCLGQILLAQRMNKKRIIAETGAGQHGVAVATVAARFGLSCLIYMGTTDMARQRPNVERMQMLGARVEPVSSGTGTLKDAMNQAIRDWVAHVETTYYLIGSAAGPHPYPRMVRDFQAIIGREARAQMLQRCGALPDEVIACIGGGSNAIGIFHGFLEDEKTALTGVEAGGSGLASGRHGAAISGGRPGILHGQLSYLLQDQDGQIHNAESISAGLDYPGIGPEHAWLHDCGRVTYTVATDAEAIAALHLCTRMEGILPALEPSHALAEAFRKAANCAPGHRILVNLCGRGDKDIATIKAYHEKHKAASR